MVLENGQIKLTKEDVVELSYYIFDPTGNITILVEGDVPADMRAGVASELMKREPTAEQVGFVSCGNSIKEKEITIAENCLTEKETARNCLTGNKKERVENCLAGNEKDVADISLGMAGGEFCGNATMSAAVLFAAKYLLNGEKSEATYFSDQCGARKVEESLSWDRCEARKVEESPSSEHRETGRVEKAPCSDICEVNVSSSGAEGIRKVWVEKLGNGLYLGTVEMPEPLSIAKKKLSIDGQEYDLPVVDFGGITHVIFDVQETPKSSSQREHTETSELSETICTDNELKMNLITGNDNGSDGNPGTSGDFGMIPLDAKKAVVKWCDDLRAESLGLMIFNSAEKRLDPYVYVPKAGTLFRESSCASGTTAVGVYLAEKEERNDRVAYSISEPGGKLTVSVIPGNKYFLTGLVKLLEKNICPDAVFC